MANEPGSKVPHPDAKPRVASDNRTPFIDAFGEYLKRLEQVPRDQYERVASAHNNYVKTLVEAAGQPNASARMQDLQYEYAKQWFDQASPEHAKRQAQQAREAYLAYLRRVQAAFTALNLESLDPATLAGIGQHLYAAAFLAGATGQGQG